MSSFKFMLLRYLKENMYPFIFVSIVFVVGVIFGSVMVNRLPEQHNQPLLNELNFYFEVLDETPAVNRLGILQESFMTNGKFILISFLSGLTVIGIPVIVLMLFMRGVILGFTVGFIFTHSSFRGLFFALTAIVPHNLFVIPALLLASVASISFSWVILLKVARNKNFNIKTYLINYCALTLLSLSLISVAALVEAYIIPVLLKWIVPLMI